MSKFNISDKVVFTMLSTKADAVVLDVLVHTSTLTGDSYTTSMIGHEMLGIYKEGEVFGSMLSKEEV